MVLIGTVFAINSRQPFVFITRFSIFPVNAQTKGQMAEFSSSADATSDADSVLESPRVSRYGRALPKDSAIYRFVEGMGPPDDEHGPDIEAGIFCSVMVLNSVIERMGNRFLEEQELTLPQWLALGTVLNAGETGVPHAQLGQRLMLSKAPVTGVVDRLERAGLVVRRPDLRDRRVSRVVGTPAGLEKWHSVHETLHDNCGSDLEHCLAEAEQLQLLHLLGRLLESFAPQDAVVAELLEYKPSKTTEESPK